MRQFPSAGSELTVWTHGSGQDEGWPPVEISTLVSSVCCTLSTRASSRHRIQPFNTHRVSELCVVASERAVHSATAVAQSGRQLHVIFVFFFFFSPFPFFLHWRFLAFWFRFLLISSSSFFRRGDSATCRSFLLVIFFYRIASWHAWIDARYAIHVFRSVFFLFWSEMYKFRLFWLTRNSMIHN